MGTRPKPCRAAVCAGCMVFTALSGDDAKRGVDMEDDMDIRLVKPFGQTNRVIYVGEKNEDDGIWDNGRHV